MTTFPKSNKHGKWRGIFGKDVNVGGASPAYCWPLGLLMERIPKSLEHEHEHEYVSRAVIS